jgi:hypothetical protein
MASFPLSTGCLGLGLGGGLGGGGAEAKQRIPLPRQQLGEADAHPFSDLLLAGQPAAALGDGGGAAAARAASSGTGASVRAARAAAAAQAEASFSGDDSEEGDCMASLFLDEDYKELTYSFLPGMEQTVLALTSAGTDFDLTGQIVWPVSVFLAWFVATNEPLFRAKTIVELGAGTGLGGFVSARVSAHTVLTDGNDVVLKMLRDGVARGHVARHVAASAREGAGGVGGVGGDGGGGGGGGGGGAHPAAPAASLAVEKLLWGDEDNFETICAALPHGYADVLIGADVVCWPAAVLPLLTTVKALLLRAPSGAAAAFYCGFVCRATMIETMLWEQCDELGIEITRIAATDFLPSPPPQNVYSRRELNLLRLSLRPGCDRQVRWQDCDAALGSAC